MKKILIGLIIIIMLFTSSAFAFADGSSGFGSLLEQIPADSSASAESTGLHNIPTDAPDADTLLRDAAVKEWTIMVYMCGTNLESAPYSGAAASRDILEMIESNYNTDKVNLILLAGGTKKWHIQEMQGHNTSIYSIRPDGITRLWEADTQMNMGDPNTLTQLLSYSVENFPAAAYGLVIWNHGSGSLGGVCADEFTNDMLSMDEIRQSISASALNGEKLEWIGFDACLMGSMEASLLLEPYARYMIASEETEPGFGWDYSFLSELESDKNGADTGKRIVDRYFNWYEKKEMNSDLTLSCIDLKKAVSLEREVDQFFSRAADVLESERLNEFIKAARAVKDFGNMGNSTKDDDIFGTNTRAFDLLDLKNLVSQVQDIVNTDGSRIQKMLQQDVVTYTKNNLNFDLGGLTIYHPMRAKNSFPKNIEVYRSFGIMPGYVDYAQRFGEILMATPAANFSSLATAFADNGKVQRSGLSLQLNEEQQDELAEAQFIVLQESTEYKDSYHLVAVSDAVYHDDKGTLNGEFVFRNLFITDENGNPIEGSSPLFYRLGSDGEILIPVTLCGKDPDTGENFEIKAYFVCKEENTVVTVVNVLTYDEMSQFYSDRSQVDLSMIERIRFDCVDRIVTYDDSGAIRDFESWKEAGVTSYYWNSGEWGELRFVEDALDEDSLYGAFCLTDLRNNMYTSALLKFTESRTGSLIFSYDDKDQLVKIDRITCVENGDGGNLVLNVALENISEDEIVVELTDLEIDEKAFSEKGFGYGSGPNSGLLKEETQVLFLMVNVMEFGKGKTLENMNFDLNVYEAETENLIATIPVKVILNIVL